MAELFPNLVASKRAKPLTDPLLALHALLATNSSPARVVRRILCSFARSQSFVSHDDRLRFNKSDHLHPLLNQSLNLHHFVEEWHSSCLGGRFTISQQGTASKRAKVSIAFAKSLASKRAKPPSALPSGKNTASKASKVPSDPLLVCSQSDWLWHEWHR